MKGFAFWVLFFVAGTVMMVQTFSNTETTLSVPDSGLAHYEDDRTVITRIRKLGEENRHHHRDMKAGKPVVSINLEDYLPIDPAPSSKASIRPGPIQHGTPVVPYIPKPPPPDPSHNPKAAALP